MGEETNKNMQNFCCEIENNYQDSSEFTKMSLKDEMYFWLYVEDGHWIDKIPAPTRLLRSLNKYNYTDLEKKLIVIGMLPDEYVIKRSIPNGYFYLIDNHLLCIDGKVVHSKTHYSECKCGRNVYSKEKLKNLSEKIDLLSDPEMLEKNY
jgi:hypothetical protein